jgi:hypothetical protein
MGAVPGAPAAGPCENGKPIRGALGAPGTAPACAPGDAGTAGTLPDT